MRRVSDISPLFREVGKGEGQEKRELRRTSETSLAVSPRSAAWFCLPMPRLSVSDVARRRPE